MNLESFSFTVAGPPLKFRLPKCGKIPVNFQKIFHPSICSEESNLLISNLEKSRLKMAKQLELVSATVSEKLDSVNEYLPLIEKLFNSLKNQPPVRLDAAMMFHWVGSFSEVENISKFPEIIFEVTMVLHAKAVLHHCLAWYMLNLDLSSNLSSAGQHFLTAAGIMEFLASSHLPQWLSMPGIVRPPETNAAVCRGMADIFSGQAQQMAVVKAMQKPGGTPNSIMVKLCVAVLRITDSGIDSLNTVSSLKLAIDPEIPLFNRTFAAGLAYFYNAETYKLKEEQETGVALGFYRESQARLTNLTTGSKIQIANYLKLCSKSPFIRHGIQYLANKINDSKAGAERDNSLIFFEAIPQYNELPALPPGALVMVR
jgi:hypothetical protein